jgi:transcription elongation factor GreA
MEYIYLTREGYEQLTKELEDLKTKKRREIADAIAKARALGDLSENAEYDAAKEAQAMNEAKINQLEDKLSRARIVEEEDIKEGEVRIGTKVKLQDLDNPREIEYMLVSELEADFDKGKISVDSPVGKSLLGYKKGDTVEIKAPARTLRYKIIDVWR